MTIPERVSFLHLSAGTLHLIPDAERPRSEQPVVNRPKQVTIHMEEIQHEADPTFESEFEEFRARC